MTPILFFVLIAAVAILILINRKKAELAQKLSSLQSAKDSLQNEIEELQKRYAPILNVDAALAERSKAVADLEAQIAALKSQEQLDSASAEQARKTLSELEENLEAIAHGLYKPHFSFDSSDDYKRKRDQLYETEKAMIKDGKAAVCATTWTVGGSAKEGERMMKQAMKLMLRAFNGECDSAIGRVSWNNIQSMETRLQKAFDAINQLGSSNQITITPEYMDLKLQELRIEYELQDKLYQEREEQKRIKQQMREEERAQAELEKAQKEAEDEAARYQKALEKAQEDASHATGKEMEKLNSKIAELEASLKAAEERKERALSRAQMTRSGHVYVISNIGSFGEHVYKIGMTRRLEPMDRVKELSDASVPFDFDVHAMIFSEDAPGLERQFHVKFDAHRLNLLNERREFFRVGIHEIERIAKEMNLEVTITKLAEAREYRASEAMRTALVDSKGRLQPTEALSETVNSPVTVLQH